MNVVLSLAVLSVLVLGGCKGIEFPSDVHIGFNQLRGSGHRTTEIRQIANFSSLVAGGGLKIDLTIGPKTSFKIEGDDNVLPLISSKVDSSGALRIHCERSFKTQKPVLLTLTTPSIRALDISGATDMSATGVKADELTVACSGASKLNLQGTGRDVKVDFSGASEVKLDGLASESLSGELSGASQLQATGKADALILDIHGASRIDLNDLSAKTAKLSLSGASQGKVSASESIDGELSGASSLTYKGTTNVHLDKSGASSASSAE